MAKKNIYRGVAEDLVKGNGVPRTRELLIDEVERALLRAFEAGKLEALPAARERALKEAQQAIALAQRGLDQALSTVKVELAELERKAG